MLFPSQSLSQVMSSSLIFSLLFCPTVAGQDKWMTLCLAFGQCQTTIPRNISVSVIFKLGVSPQLKYIHWFGFSLPTVVKRLFFIYYFQCDIRQNMKQRMRWCCNKNNLLYLCWSQHFIDPECGRKNQIRLYFIQRIEQHSCEIQDAWLIWL